MHYLDPIDTASAEFGDLYDELPLWSAPFGLALLDRVPLRIGQTVLDLGAGSGFLTIELAERCGAGATVIAVDPWVAAMARLRRKVAQRGLSNVVLLEQDAAHLDLPAGSVDVIVSNLGINNFAAPSAVLRVCKRLARPGASFLLTTNLVGHMAEFYEVFARVLAEAGQHDRLAVLDAHVRHRATVESTTRLLDEHGFAVDGIATQSFRWRFADGSALLRHFFIRLGFVEAWKAIPSEDRRDDTFARLERALNELAAAAGELALTVPLACVTARRRESR